MELNDWLTVVATLLSPLIALQVSEIIAGRKRKRDEKLRIFSTLMSTRASNLDPRHVEALNMIDVVFHSSDKKEVEIRRLWKQYLDHLSDKAYPLETWGVKRVELMVELLHAMAQSLDFDFDKTHIKNQCYYPEGYGNLQYQNLETRNAVLDVLTGKRPIRMSIDNIPPVETPTMQPLPKQ